MDTIYFVNEIAFGDEISPFGAYPIPPQGGFIPKRRKPVLVGNVAKRLRELIEEKANELGLEILAMEIMPDHIHLFVSAPPTISPHQIMFRHQRLYFPNIARGISSSQKTSLSLDTLVFC